MSHSTWHVMTGNIGSEKDTITGFFSQTDRKLLTVSLKLTFPSTAAKTISTFVTFEAPLVFKLVLVGIQFDLNLNYNAR